MYTIEKKRPDGSTETASQIISPRHYMNYLQNKDNSRKVNERKGKRDGGEKGRQGKEKTRQEQKGKDIKIKE